MRAFHYYCGLMALSLTIAFASISCMTASKYARKNMDTSIVPPDFDPNKHILLLEEMPRKSDTSRSETVTRKLDKAFKKYYKYRYEIVSRKDIYELKGKYRDTSVYKFAILNSLSSFIHSTTTTVTHTTANGTYTHSVSPSATTTTVDFYFYDRSKNEAYPETGNSHSNLSAFSHAYIELIDLALQHKQK